ncbi:hypothetical protein Gotri_016479, partial [Gossypium trilobum]|nr:hypothetical protein [Gossypium trilobum]
LKVVKAIQETFSTISNSVLIKRNHHLLKNVGPWTIQHIRREFDNIANYITKLTLKVFKEIPREVLEVSPIDLVSGNLAQENPDVF